MATIITVMVFTRIQVQITTRTQRDNHIRWCPYAYACSCSVISICILLLLPLRRHHHISPSNNTPRANELRYPALVCQRSLSNNQARDSGDGCGTLALQPSCSFAVLHAWTYIRSPLPKASLGQDAGMSSSHVAILDTAARTAEDSHGGN